MAIVAVGVVGVVVVVVVLRDKVQVCCLGMAGRWEGGVNDTWFGGASMIPYSTYEVPL